MAVTLPSPTWANSAEVILVIGQGEKRESEKAAWTSAAPTHKIPAGGYVRTLTNSQMGLLLIDRTQIRLNQNSLMQIKSVAEAAEWTQTSVRLNAGRAWSQARPARRPDTDAGKSARLTMETPSATLSIRGTDWEVEILPDGSTQVVVLSGVVDIGNEAGSLNVETGERAVAEPGRSPTKSRLVNPRKRVQWVSHWQSEPLRWGGSSREAGVRLTADALMHRGEIRGAAELLAQTGAMEPLTVALLARILASDDRLDEGRSRVAEALRDHPHDRELLLASGDLAILDGDVPAARAALRMLLEDDASAAEAWLGLAHIESERGHLRLAGFYLDRAEAAHPAHRPTQTERAAVETLAGNFDAAESALAAVIGEDPENYAAIVARGLNRLRRGYAEEALKAFLEAETIEPRYARASLYAAAAFYRRDDREYALRALEQARRLDPRDPLPDMLEGLILSDDLDFGGAIAAARRAQGKLVFLKSLDQLANDQRGSANLGSALANFGLESWSAYYATLSATPFWAGSHLFRADREEGRFNKNSALFLGFLTDPTVFGASNRNSNLLAAPGHYAKVDLLAGKAAWNQSALIGTLNGMVVEPFPVAYFLSGDGAGADARENAGNAASRQFTLGLGIRPQYDLGMFAFATDGQVTANLHSPTLADDRLTQDEERIDFGLNFKLAPDRQFWIKTGSGTQRNRADGAYVSDGVAASLNRAFATNIFQPQGTLDDYRTTADRSDHQFRFATALDAGLLSFGIETARSDSPGLLDASFSPARMSLRQESSSRSRDAYLSLRYAPVRDLTIQGDLWYQESRVVRRETSTLSLPSLNANYPLEDARFREEHSGLHPRLGIHWRRDSLASLRWVVQQWRRPAAAGSLGETETLGIPVNDRLVTTGGLYRRVRLQFDVESSGQSFFQGFIDDEHIDNGLNGRASLVPALESEQLDSLKNRRPVFAPVVDLEETPEFERGRAVTVGVTGNFLPTSHQSVAVRYLYRESRQERSENRLRIPYMPRHMLRIGSQWSLPGKLAIGLHATFRSQRFRDRDNREALMAGWSLGANGYWESTDKRNGIQWVIDHLVRNARMAVQEKPTFSFRYTCRF